MLSRIFTKLAEEALVGVGMVAVTAVIANAPKIAQAAKDKAPEAFEAVKDATANTAATAKVVGSLAAAKFKGKFGK